MFTPVGAVVGLVLATTTTTPTGDAFGMGGTEPDEREDGCVMPTATALEPNACL